MQDRVFMWVDASHARLREVSRLQVQLLQLRIRYSFTFDQPKSPGHEIHVVVAARTGPSISIIRLSAFGLYCEVNCFERFRLPCGDYIQTL
jgi:hypothetical protein